MSTYFLVDVVQDHFIASRMQRFNAYLLDGIYMCVFLNLMYIICSCI